MDLVEFKKEFESSATIENEKLKHENDALKTLNKEIIAKITEMTIDIKALENRCFALTSWSFCILHCTISDKCKVWQEHLRRM